MAESAYNLRLFLKPTPVGQLIRGRCEEPGADRQADLRRWIELGFMAERKGFYLEDSALRHADIQFGPSVLLVPGVGEGVATASVQVSQRVPDTVTASGPCHAEPVCEAAVPEAETVQGSSIAQSLRNLSA